ncbi:SpoIIE family protein phosphatase [Streptomyces sp. R302]|uniref:SpoIIE family protein phosphatase n=1 Tax=unclassified Streptomyces TaxID=2593676 RepID=UPI00145CD696|nr:MULTISPECIES: SpoIIE family protein phosphatase [unclassified Streptomyces]NML52699.1 SpoIIE family protein phosphatase [Streptomyces sp. R301]NML80372.1 SpoIIE family protein phosphatase [Streptomyces sp. R302]
MSEDVPPPPGPEGAAALGGVAVSVLDHAVLDAVFSQSSVGVHVLDRELRLVRVTGAALAMRGVAEEDVLGRPAVEAYRRFGVEVREDVLREVLDGGPPARDVLVRGRTARDADREHVYSVSVYPLHAPGPDGAERPAIGLVATVTDVTDRILAEQRLALLYQARERIGRTLDVERTARELVEVTAPGFAGSVVVALTDAVLRGKPPELRRAGETPLLRCTAVGGSGQGDAGQPLPEPGAVLLPGLFGERLPDGPELWRWDGEVRIVAPLSVRGQLLGAVAFRRPPGADPYTEDDLAVVEGITAHTATCLENALRFTREHTVMTALQSWPLRPDGETRHAVELAQRHRPGGTGGGSWFDVIALPGARVALVVGQVERPGLSSVATMGRLRTAVYSLATLDLAPHELLARLHAVTRRLAREQGPAHGKGQGGDEPAASCTVAVHDPVTGRLDLARAGTSLCVAVRPDGSLDADLVDEGPLLGDDGPPFACSSHFLPEGTTLCLASSARADGGPSRARVAEALAAPDRGTHAMADELAALLAPERVLLVARTLRLPATDVAEWEVPGELSAVAPTRHAAEERVREWGLGVEPLTVELIVSELVTNAVRHGAPPYALRLLRGGSTLTVEVRDGAATAPHLRHAKAGDEGGRGLHICAMLADAWGVRHDGARGEAEPEAVVGGDRADVVGGEGALPFQDERGQTGAGVTGGAVEGQDADGRRPVEGMAAAGGLLVGVGQDPDALLVAELVDEAVGPPVRRLVVAAGEVAGAVDGGDGEEVAAGEGERGAEEGVRGAAGAGRDDLDGGPAPVGGDERLRDPAGRRAAQPDGPEPGQLVHQRPGLLPGHPVRKPRPVERGRQALRHGRHARGPPGRAPLHPVDPLHDLPLRTEAQRVEVPEPVRHGLPARDRTRRFPYVLRLVEHQGLHRRGLLNAHGNHLRVFVM